MKRFLALGLSVVTGVWLTGCATTSGGANSTSSANSNRAPAAKAAPVGEPGDFRLGQFEADVMYNLLVAELAGINGDGLTAAKYYVAAAKQSRETSISARAVRVAGAANRFDLALEAAQVWVQVAQDNGEATRVLAVLLLRNGKTDEAKEQLRSLIESDPEAAGRNFVYVGQMLGREAEKNSAVDVASYLAGLYPNTPEAHFTLAMMQQRAGTSDAALNSVDRAIQLKSTWSEAVVLRAKILVDQGKKEAALTTLREHVATNPEDNSARLSYARLLVDERKLEDARVQFELLAVKMPENDDVLFALSMLAMQSKKYDEAQTYLEKLDALGRDSPQVTYYLGQVFERKEQFDKAMRYYSSIRVGEYFVNAQLRIAFVLSKTKGLDDARAHLHTIQPGSPEDEREIVLFEGDLLKQAKRYQDVFDHYNAALQRFPKDTEMLYWRALSAEQLGKTAMAIEDLTYVINLEPENAAALNALGFTLTDRTDRHKEALGYIERAIKLEPNDAAIVDSVGWVHFRLGDFAKALEYLRKAASMMEDPEVSAHLGEVLWVTGEKDEALKIWKSAREKNPDNEGLKKTMVKFGQL